MTELGPWPDWPLSRLVAASFQPSLLSKISLVASIIRPALNGFSTNACPGILILTSPGLPVMKMTGIGRSEQID